jgi:hypothetical protein
MYRVNLPIGKSIPRILATPCGHRHPICRAGHWQRASVVVLALLLGSCESTYYDAMEQIGIHKRDILIDRIVDAQEAQQDGQVQFKNALEQFRSVVNFDGGELETIYDRLNGEYEDSVSVSECEPSSRERTPTEEHEDALHAPADRDAPGRAID